MINSSNFFSSHKSSFFSLSPLRFCYEMEYGFARDERLKLCYIFHKTLSKNASFKSLRNEALFIRTVYKKQFQKFKIL